MGNAADDTDRLGRTKAEFLILYRPEPDSIELKQAMERLNKQAAELGISMDDIDTATFSHLERNHFCFMRSFDRRRRSRTFSSTMSCSHGAPFMPRDGYAR